jgi:hypothetical protein
MVSFAWALGGVVGEGVVVGELWELELCEFGEAGGDDLPDDGDVAVDVRFVGGADADLR